MYFEGPNDNPPQVTAFTIGAPFCLGSPYSSVGSRNPGRQFTRATDVLSLPLPTALPTSYAGYIPRSNSQAQSRTSPLRIIVLAVGDSAALFLGLVENKPRVNLDGDQQHAHSHKGIFSAPTLNSMGHLCILFY